MCFKDKTFCVAECGNIICDRLLTEEVVKAAEVWWGKPGAPICMEDLSPYCAEFVEKKND